MVCLFTVNARAEVTAETCAYFYDALEQVPHESIFQQEGMFASKYLEVGVNGCIVVMISDNERLGDNVLPDFSASTGDALYQSGWRNMPKYAADGPGEGFWGLEKGNELCFIYMEQPNSLTKSGEVTQKGYVNARVECLDHVQGPCPAELDCEETAKAE
jgi:hypothetical protein